MIVKASLFSDYQFAPLYPELAQFAARWPGKMKPSGQGYTLIGYDAIPEFAIKGEALPGCQPFAATRAFPSKAALLTFAKAGISPLTGVILEASAGLSAPGGLIGRNAAGYEANHLPLILGVYPIAQQPDRVCVAINGNYDLQTGIFSGTLDFLSLGEIWSA